MKNTTVYSAAALIALAGAAFAQPPGVTMEQINTTLPVEGAPLAVPGPYQVDLRAGVRLSGTHGLSPG